MLLVCGMHRLVSGLNRTSWDEAAAMSQVRRYAAAGLDAAVAGRVALDQCQARLYTAILRHFVPVMAALAICAVTAARLRDRTNGQAAPPTAHRRT